MVLGRSRHSLCVRDCVRTFEGGLCALDGGVSGRRRQWSGRGGQCVGAVSIFCDRGFGHAAGIDCWVICQLARSDSDVDRQHQCHHSHNDLFAGVPGEQLVTSRLADRCDCVYLVFVGHWVCGVFVGARISDNAACCA